MVTIRQIKLFIALAENLHFSRTARKLNITQAALSKEINQLEKSLSCQLFDRSDKWNIMLTAAGAAYLEQIKNLPEQLDYARKQAQRASRGETGTLSIAVTNMVYDYLQLGDLFKKMHQLYPDVKLFIHDWQASPMAYSEVRSGSADIAFLAVSNHVAEPAGLRHFKLCELGISLALPANHPLVKIKNISFDDLKNCNFIMPPVQQIPWLRNYFEEKFFEKFQCKPQIEQEVLGIRATRQLVSAGLGIGLVIEPENKDKRENIVYRKAPFDCKRIINAVWEENNQSQVLKNITKLLPELLKKN